MTARHKWLEHIHSPTARAIVDRVITEARLHPEEFFSAARERPLVKARMHAASQLVAAKFTPYRIGFFLKRNHSTIAYYLGAEGTSRSSKYYYRRVLRHLSPDHRQAVVDYAASEAVSVEVLVAQWVGERIEHEIRAKARAAA